MSGSNRDNGIDLLRILAAFLVVLAHVLGPFYGVLAENGGKFPAVMYLYEALISCSVSVFFIISGAFVLSNDRYSSFRVFYRNMTKNIVIPTIIFSLYYLIYSAVPYIIKGDQKKLMNVLSEALHGRPYYHMWYLYTILGIYLFVPAIIRLRHLAGEALFEKISIVIFISSVVSDMTSTHKFQYDPGAAYRYVGYLFIGYVVYRHMKEKKNPSGYFVIWLAALSVLAYGKYMQNVKPDIPYILHLIFVSVEVLLPVLLFICFARLNVKRSFALMTSLGLYIYLFHAGVLDMLLRLSSMILGKNVLLKILPPQINVIFISASVFVLSILISYIYDLIQRRVEARLRLRDRLYFLIRKIFACVFKV